MHRHGLSLSRLNSIKVRQYRFSVKGDPAKRRVRFQTFGISGISWRAHRAIACSRLVIGMSLSAINRPADALIQVKIDPRDVRCRCLAIRSKDSMLSLPVRSWFAAGKNQIRLIPCHVQVPLLNRDESARKKFLVV
jgi:hypothetical protein